MSFFQNREILSILEKTQKALTSTSGKTAAIFSGSSLRMGLVVVGCHSVTALHHTARAVRLSYHGSRIIHSRIANADIQAFRIEIRKNGGAKLWFLLILEKLMAFGTIPSYFDRRSNKDASLQF